MPSSSALSFFFFNDTATTEIYTLSLHDALPISSDSANPASSSPRAIGFSQRSFCATVPCFTSMVVGMALWIPMERSEEHTSELQSPCNLVCRLLLEKKNNAPEGLLLRGDRLRLD